MINETTKFEFGDVVELVYGDDEKIRGIFLREYAKYDCCVIAEEGGGISFDIWLGRVRLIRKGNFND